MQAPASLYGLAKDVKARSQKVVAQLKRGAGWDEAVGAGELIDTAGAPGLLVIDGPNPLLGGQPHFHLFMPIHFIWLAIAQKRLPREIDEQVFQEAIRTAWGVLSLMGGNNSHWLYLPDRLTHRAKPFLSATLRDWQVFIDEGPRFSDGSNTGRPFWQVANGLKYVLANLGVPAEILNAPSPPDPSSLVRYVKSN